MGEQPGAVAVVVVANSLALEAVIGGRSAIERVLSALDPLPGLQQVVVAPQVEIGDEVPERFTRRVSWSMPQAARLGAIRSALRVAGPSSTVLVHDADQPLITSRCLADVLAATATHPAVACGAPVKAAFKRVVDGVIEETIPRHRLIRLVGPRAFRRGVLAHALQRADVGRWPCDDEVRAACLAGVPVAIHPFTDVNIRVAGALSSNLVGRLATGL